MEGRGVGDTIRRHSVTQAQQFTWTQGHLTEGERWTVEFWHTTPWRETVSHNGRSCHMDALDAMGLIGSCWDTTGIGGIGLQ
eukprot:207941-Rhodomonas_salina.1